VPSVASPFLANNGMTVAARMGEFLRHYEEVLPRCEEFRQSCSPHPPY
jgi:hypothetical protein